MARNLILKDSTGGIRKHFQTPDSQNCVCAGAGPNSISEQAWGAHPFVSHAVVTKEEVSAHFGQASAVKSLVIKTTV